LEKKGEKEWVERQYEREERAGKGQEVDERDFRSPFLGQQEKEWGGEERPLLSPFDKAVKAVRLRCGS